MEPLFGREELDPNDPGPRLLEELAQRARWLASLNATAKAELVDAPLAVVEERYLAWRVEHVADEAPRTTSTAT